MFGFLKKKDKEQVSSMTACADGMVVPMKEANDPVFSSCALGNGVVIRPTGDLIVAPADGTVTVTMAGNEHAVGMELDGGIEILLHIGVDTANLKGKGFQSFVKTGDVVKTGQKLIQFDREAMEAKGYCMEVMQIVMDSEEAEKIQYTTGIEAKAGETIIASW